MPKFDGSMISKLITGLLDDDMYKSFCARCSKYKEDKVDGREICPVDFKMENPECEHHQAYSVVAEHAASIQKAIIAG